MTKYKKIILILFCVIVSNTSLANSFIGADIKYAWMPGKKTPDYSLKRVLPKNYLAGELYYSYIFRNDVGLNFAYERYGNRTKNHIFSAGETFLGDTQNAGDTTNTKARIQIYHIDMLGFYEKKSLSFVGQLGLAIMQAKITGSITTGGVTTNLNPSNSYRVVPRIGLGVQYFAFSNFGMRAMLNWLGSNMYRISITDEDGIRYRVKAFSQSVSFGIGLVARF